MRDKNKVQWCQKTTYSQKNAGQLHTEGVCVCVRVWKCVCESLCVCVHVSRPRSDEMHCQPSPNPSQVAFTSAVSPLPSPSPSPLPSPSQQSRCSTQPVSVSWMGSALRCSWLHEWIAMAPSPATAPHRSNYCNYYEIMQNAYAISRRDPLPPPQSELQPKPEPESVYSLHLHLSPSLSLSHGATGLTWLRTSTRARVALQVTRSSCKQGRSCSNWSLGDLSYQRDGWRS